MNKEITAAIMMTEEAALKAFSLDSFAQVECGSNNHLDICWHNRMLYPYGVYNLVGETDIDQMTMKMSIQR
jgi:hypothetical protein